MKIEFNFFSPEFNQLKYIDIRESVPRERFRILFKKLCKHFSNV